VECKPNVSPKEVIMVTSLSPRNAPQSRDPMADPIVVQRDVDANLKAVLTGHDRS
jgi:hypothetical protein